MPLETGTFGISGSVYPLTSSTSNSLLKDADTPIYWMLDYFYNMLTTYANARWQSQAALVNLTSHMPNIVGMKFPNNPFPYLQDTQIKFPMLAIYRVDGKMMEKTISYDRIQSNLEIAWVMSPLTMSQMEIMGPFKNVVLDIISDRSGVAFDPNYKPAALFSDGYNWGEAAGFDWLQVTDYTMVNIPHTQTNLPMEAVVMKIAMRERNMPVTGAFEAFTGMDTDIDLINNPNDTPPDILEDFVVLNSDHNPGNFPP
jgi:hypothetical protein